MILFNILDAGEKADGINLPSHPTAQVRRGESSPCTPHFRERGGGTVQCTPSFQGGGSNPLTLSRVTARVPPHSKEGGWGQGDVPTHSRERVGEPTYLIIPGRKGGHVPTHSRNGGESPSPFTTSFKGGGGD